MCEGKRTRQTSRIHMEGLSKITKNSYGRLQCRLLNPGFRERSRIDIQLALKFW